ARTLARPRTPHRDVQRGAAARGFVFESSSQPPERPMSRPESWPGGDRRDPSLNSTTYAVRAPLAAWLRTEAARAAADLGRYRVLDVGCGSKPYYPFFEPHAAEYVGVDVDNPAAELEGAVESLPVE